MQKLNDKTKKVQKKTRDSLLVNERDFILSSITTLV